MYEIEVERAEGKLGEGEAAVYFLVLCAVIILTYLYSHLFSGKRYQNQNQTPKWFPTHLSSNGAQNASRRRFPTWLRPNQTVNKIIEIHTETAQATA